MLRSEDALICDFAETYHILDYKGLPVKLVASLAAGLRETSRSMMILQGATASPDILLLAGIVDRLSLLLWSKTKDAAQGRNAPESIVDGLIGNASKLVRFTSGKEFENERRRILQRLERTSNGN